MEILFHALAYPYAQLNFRKVFGHSPCEMSATWCETKVGEAYSLNKNV